MRRKLMAAWGWWSPGWWACGDEDPTGVGLGPLGPGVRTYEVVLDAEDFLVRDTTFDGIGTLDDAVFRMAAHEFDGELEARTLFSLTRPTTVTYTVDNATGSTASRSVVGGTLTLVVDTVAAVGGAGGPGGGAGDGGVAPGERHVGRSATTRRT
jgi:hypothetical protein